MAEARGFGVALLAGLMVLTGAAYAAEPGAPEQLAAQAAGVVGSGDQLSLRLKTAQGDLTLKLGEVYEDGWRLVGLTPTQATLVKDGTTREIGLNPTGQLASATPPPPPSRVTLLGLPDDATIQAFVDRAPDEARMTVEWAMKLGLDQDEALRVFAYRGLIDDEFDRRAAAGGAMTLTPADQRALLGQTAYEDGLALELRTNNALVAPDVADLAARPVSGPTRYYVPAGVSSREVATAQGVDRRGAWTMSSPDAQGGITFTLIAGTAEAFAAKYILTSPAAMEGDITR